MSLLNLFFFCAEYVVLDEKKSLVFTIAFRLLMQVRKAQSSQSGLNPSGSKNAKGMMTCALVYLVVYLTYKLSVQTRLCSPLLTQV